MSATPLPSIRSTAWVAAQVALGGFLFGFDAAVVSGIVSYIVPEFSLNELQLGLVVGAPTLAGILSSLASGVLSDLLGRQRVLIILAVLYVLSAVGAALAPNYELLVAARFIGGLAFASLSIAPLYIAEIAPESRRGFLVSFNQFNIMIGFSAAYFANYFFQHASQLDLAWVAALGIDKHTWRWMLAAGALPAVLWLFMLMRIPESPRWLALKGRFEEARAVLARVRPGENIDLTLQQIRESVASQSLSLRDGVTRLFHPTLKLALTIGLIIGIAQQVTGVNAVYFYAPSIFEQTGIGTDASFAQATLIGVINVIFTVIAMLLIDRLGRRPLLLIGLVGIVVSTALCSYAFSQARYQLTPAAVAELPAAIDRSQLTSVVDVEYTDDRQFKTAMRQAIGDQALKTHEAAIIQASIRIDPYLVLAGILGFVASFAVSLGPVMWVLFSEIFPNSIRGLAIAVVGFFNSIASFAVQFLFPWELRHLGNSYTFAIFSVLGVLSLALMAWLLPETKGRTLEQLETDLAKG